MKIRIWLQEDIQSITNGRETTFVPKSVRAIAILFFAISKFGETARHLPQQGNKAHISSAQVNPGQENYRNQVQGPGQVQKEKIKDKQAVRQTAYWQITSHNKQ